MNFLDRLFSYLGYVRAQRKPTGYPYDQSNNSELHDSRYIMDPASGDLVTPPTNAHPENLATDVNKQLENVPKDLKSKDSYFPFLYNDDNKTGEELGQNNTHPDFTNLKFDLNPYIDPINTKEVKKISQIFAAKMEKLGILYVDRKLFMEQYNKLVKEAVLAGKPISDYIEEKIDL
jgi:hypothetical protein